ncbi:MAG TPA: acetylglutamate kinase [Chitinophagaceae bacterium]
MQNLSVIKIGGNIIDDPVKLSDFLQRFAALKGHKILVHGGGKLATRLAEQLGIQQQMIDGRRITDAETLRIVTMVYAGYINKNIVAQLQALNCNALGLTGADADLLQAKKRVHELHDYGFVGDIDSSGFRAKNWISLIDAGLTPVMSPITHNGHGQLLNTNADTVAQEIAKGLSGTYKTSLVYTFEKSGVLANVNDESSVINLMNPSNYASLKEKGLIFAGMIPKLDNAFAALSSGVKKVIIGKAEDLYQLIEGNAGTTIIND